MTDHPTTFNAEPADPEHFDWDDRASLHEAHDGQGVFDAAKGLRQGTFAELVRYMMMLPADERAGYAIQKAGDRKYTAAEIEALASRDDFPRG